MTIINDTCNLIAIYPVQITFRYLSNSDLVSRLKNLHHDHRVMSKQFDRLKCNISQSIQRDGVSVDAEVHCLLQETLKNESAALLQGLPNTSFQALFWKQPGNEIPVACAGNLL